MCAVDGPGVHDFRTSPTESQKSYCMLWNVVSVSSAPLSAGNAGRAVQSLEGAARARSVAGCESSEHGGRGRKDV
jgi:hypothetical protein